MPLYIVFENFKLCHAARAKICVASETIHVTKKCYNMYLSFILKTIFSLIKQLVQGVPKLYNMMP